MSTGLHSHPFDAITIDDLRGTTSGLKWTHFPDKLGAFIAEMDFGCADEITATLHDSIDRAQFGYTPSAFYEELASATAGWVRTRYGWELDTADVHVVPDVLSVLRVEIERFTTPGSPVIVPTPNYMPFLTIPPSMNRTVIEVPMVRHETQWDLDLDAIDSAFAAGAELLVLCNPGNPTGEVHSRAQLEALSEVVARHGAKVFSDEIHAPLVFSGHEHVPYASISDEAAAHTTTAMSASKAWNLPGLKCAQVITTNEDHRDAWTRLPRYVNRAAGTMGVIANTAAYEHGGPWLDGVVDYLEVNRDRVLSRLATELPEARMHVPKATYFAWVDLSDCGLGESPRQTLFDDVDLAVVDGTECGQGLAGHVRLTLATPAPILEEVITRIVECSNRER